MNKRLVKNGHSFALVIDKPLLKSMQVTPETDIEIRHHGNALIIRKADAWERKENTAGEEGAEVVRFGKRLIKTGRSYALIIDKALLDLVEIDAWTELDIRPYGRALILQKMGTYETAAERRRREKKEEEEGANEMFLQLQQEEREKEPWERLVLVDGKWVVKKTKGEEVREEEEKGKE